MTDSDLPEMPWGGILRFTAKVAGAVFVGATGLCVAELRRLRHEKEESERFRNRWTDKNRWE